MATPAPSAPSGVALALFERWLDLPPDEQPRELDRLQAQDPALLADLLRLIDADAHAQADGFLAGRAINDAGRRVADTPPTAEPAPQPQIGPWTLEHAIGVGGMGRVWRARRDDGMFEGIVAIKTLHDASPDAFAHERFAREGQILARLSHPNIARLLDAGTLDNGQRYLVLEYVDGTRIDHYCDAHRLDIPARVRLFLQVCAAVAHAHTNLVVHRDLKPSNILVMAGAQVKLLDFGVAKLIEDESAAGDESPLTRLAGAGLTPEYAAPEQIDGGPITTSTDVYALGMVLYRLLSGRRPYGNDTASPARLARAIVETEPTPLSTSIRDHHPAAALDACAAQRATSPERLRRLLRGDLDNIVAKTLRKAPHERYGSVRELIEDLERHLANKPVAARADRLSYRLGKFIRRHWLGVSAATALTLAVVVGAAGMIWQGRIALEQEAEARRQALLAKAESAKATAVKDFLLNLFRANSPAAADLEKARRMTARDLLDTGSQRVNVEFAHEPQLRQEILDIVGELYYGLGEYARAADLARQRLAVLDSTPGMSGDATRDALQNLGHVLQALGDTTALDETVDRLQASLEAEDAAPNGDRAWVLTARARAALPQAPDVAIAHASAALRALDHDDHLTLYAGRRRLAWSVLAEAHALRENPGAAVAAAQAAYDMSVRVSTPDALVSAISLGVLGQAERGAEALAAAERDLDRALQIVQRRMGKAHPQALIFQAHLGAVRCRRGDYTRGAALIRDALAQLDRGPGANSADGLTMRLELAQAHYDAGAFADVGPLIDTALQQLPETTDWRHLRARALTLHSLLLTARGKYDAAQRAAAEAARTHVDAQGAPLPSAIQAHAAAAEALLAQGRLAEARDALRVMQRIAEASGLRVPVNRQRGDLLEAEVRLWRGEPRTSAKAFSALAERLDLDDERDYHWATHARALLGRGRALLIGGRIPEACAALRRAVELRMRPGVSASPWLAQARVDLADCLAARHEPEAAADLRALAAAAYAQHAPLGRQFTYPLDRPQRER